MLAFDMDSPHPLMLRWKILKQHLVLNAILTDGSHGVSPRPSYWCSFPIGKLITAHIGVRRFQLESAWLGKGPSIRKLYNSHYGNVHRIKVDEKAGYTITTFSGGGLVVANIHHNQTLWSLPSV
jgi:hypothetical protein